MIHSILDITRTAALMVVSAVTVIGLVWVAGVLVGTFWNGVCWMVGC